MTLPPISRDAQGVAWLLTDMSLLVCSLSIVKLLGATYPAIQIVFCRAVIGVLIMMPVTWAERGALLKPKHPWLNLVRVVLNVCAMTANFASVTLLSLSLITTINFIRPFLLLALAALILRERVMPRAWVGVAMGFAGVLVAVQPALDGDRFGVMLALAASVVGTLSVIAMRAIVDESPRTLMVYSSIGLALFSAPMAIPNWQPITREDLPLVLAVGVMGQIGQYCFIRAHQAGSAGRLATTSYAQFPLALIAGFIFFNDVPSLATFLGAGIIILANLLVAGGWRFGVRR